MMKLLRIGKTTALLFVLMLSVSLPPLSGRAWARDFTIAMWGGENQQYRIDAYVRPYFEERGLPFLQDVYRGGWGKFQTMKDTGILPWDVVQVESSELVRGCEEGVFLELDWSRIADKSEFVANGARRCGVGMSVWALALSYNTDLASDPPGELEDFWNLDEWPGRRAMRRGPKTNLEFALLADGVPPEDIYDVLSTPDGVDRAFAMLDRIKPHLQLWKAGAQAVDLVASGEAAMGFAYSGRIGQEKLAGRPIDFIWDHAIYDIDSFVILSGSEHVDTAYGLLKHYAEYQGHSEVSASVVHGPALVRAVEALDPQTLAMLPAGSNLDNALFLGSDRSIAFWLDHLETLTERWNAWLNR